MKNIFKKFQNNLSKLKLSVREMDRIQQSQSEMLQTQSNQIKKLQEESKTWQKRNSKAKDILFILQNNDQNLIQRLNHLRSLIEEKRYVNDNEFEKQSIENLSKLQMRIENIKKKHHLLSKSVDSYNEELFEKGDEINNIQNNFISLKNKFHQCEKSINYV